MYSYCSDKYYNMDFSAYCADIEYYEVAEPPNLLK